MGEKELMIVGDPKIHLSLAWWKGGEFIELSKDNNPFANPDKKLRTSR
jgi:hypothetical protein